MEWILRLTIPAADSELATSLLWDLNPTGIAEIQVDRGTEPTVELLAGFASEAEARAATSAIASWPRPGADSATGLGSAGGDSCSGSEVGGRGRAWPEATAEPVDESAWIDPDRRVTFDIGRHHLELEVGGAFGDGNHASTQLALALLSGELTNFAVSEGASVLDVGTGTGILALVARARGVGAVTAVDNDPRALAVAARNLARHPDLTPGSTVTLTDSMPPAGRFDVVVANLVLGVQRDLAPLMAARLDPAGALILAGLLVEQEADVCSLHPTLDVARRLVDGDWLGLVLRAPDPEPPAAEADRPDGGAP